MEFIENSGKLNELEHYPQLKERCKLIGYEVSKVVFRGYYAAPKLQAMHDNAIMARSKLKLQASTFLPTSVKMTVKTPKRNDTVLHLFSNVFECR